MVNTPTLGDILMLISLVVIVATVLAAAVVLIHPATHVVIDQDRGTAALVNCGDDTDTVVDYAVTNDRYSVINIEFGSVGDDCTVLAELRTWPSEHPNLHV